MVNAYKDAGVNVEKADKLVEHLGMSGYGAVVDLAWGPKVVLSTDGVGTKILVAEQLNKFDTIGIDLVAMCVNDVLCQGAQPVSFLDYYATGKLDLEKSKQILSGIQKGCEMANCTLVGGETAEMPGVYKGSNFDLAGFVMGVVVDELPKRHLIKPGSAIIGVPSSGPHSNGYSLLRKLYNNKFDLSLLEPTRIYAKEVLPALKYIKAIAHITGGGIHGNLPRVLPADVSYKLDITLNDWWQALKLKSKMNMYDFECVFNCGWGLLIVTDENEAQDVCNIIKDAQVIGEIIR
jgi:phosphoribosylformylglycinamidine cyclo-ligase